MLKDIEEIKNYFIEYEKNYDIENRYMEISNKVIKNDIVELNRIIKNGLNESNKIRIINYRLEQIKSYKSDPVVEGVIKEKIVKFEEQLEKAKKNIDFDEIKAIYDEVEKWYMRVETSKKVKSRSFSESNPYDKNYYRYRYPTINDPGAW